MSTALIQVRIDEQLKDDVVALYEGMGIDISTAIRIFFKNRWQNVVFRSV